jgi:predicted phosphodiesterase
MRIACFGGIYSNYLALEAAIADARRRGVDELFCLGDLGAFGPHPDRVFPILHQHGVRCVQGNYDDSIGRGLDDCQCGYTDPRDNHFAAISYQYTLQHTADSNRKFLRCLPNERRIVIDGKIVLLCHGSPRRTNEFLWESTSSTHFLRHLADHCQSDVIAATHTGIKWYRDLGDERHFINVGVLGRPENDGRTNVWYAIIGYRRGRFSFEFVPVHYDHLALVKEMADEGLPREFIETIATGWWTTCLEILPEKERRRGKW